MNKSFKWIVSLLITVFALSMMGGVVFAEEDGAFKDGVYKIDYTVNYEGEDSPVDVDGYFEKPATLTVEDGKQSIQLKYTATNFINELIVPNAEVEIIDEDKEKNTRVLSIKTEADLTEPMEMGLKMFYGQTHDVITEFDVSGVPIKEETEDESDKENPITEGIVKEEGFYTIPFDALHEEENKPSTMANYMADTAFVSVQDGKVYLTLAFADETITNLTVNGNDSNGDTKVKGHTRYETFELDSLPSVLDGVHVEYQAPTKNGVHKGQADFRISFAEDSVTEATEDDRYAAAYVKVERPGNNNEGNDNNSSDEKQTNQNEGTDEEDNQHSKDIDNQSALIPDEAFEYDYIVKHETEDRVSAADNFFVKPATVLYKDGEKYIQLTITDWEYVKSLSYAGNEVHVVEVKDDGSAVVQFKVDEDLADAIMLDMHITVPEEVAGMPYDMNHSARLILDLDSKQEVDASDFTLSILGDDSSGDGITDEEATTSNSEAQVTNPQTGDTSNVWFYTLLLMGSILIPSAFMIKRRFANQ